jgi:hypothetical protein
MPGRRHAAMPRIVLKPPGAVEAPAPSRAPPDENSGAPQIEGAAQGDEHSGAHGGSGASDAPPQAM